MTAAVQKTPVGLSHGGRRTLRCQQCNGLFHPKRWDAKTCSQKCRQQSYRNRVTENPSQCVTDNSVLDELLRDAMPEDEVITDASPWWDTTAGIVH